MTRQNKKVRRLFSRHPKTTGALILVAGAAAGYLAFGGGELTTSPNTSTNGKPATGKTDNETKKPPQRPNDPKAETPKQEEPDDENSKRQVTPVITSVAQESSNIVVRGYVNGVFEDGGICTATFTRGGKTVSGSSKGFENVSYTTCGPIRIARSKFNTYGDWLLKLSYASAKAEGSSSSQTVKVE